MNTAEFVRQNRQADVETLALRMRQYPEVDAAFALQQIAGWQKAREKLPELAEIRRVQEVQGVQEVQEWLWPKRLSLEQCSSEVTAKYKRGVIGNGYGLQVLSSQSSDDRQSRVQGYRRLVDLTGGLGVDCYYLSPGFREVHYVERDEELCRLAAHNFALTGRNVTVHNTTAEEWLDNGYGLRVKGYREDTTLFIDPARRDGHGGKVFRLEDCEPNVVVLLNILRAHARKIMLKLSPMLDITAAVKSLGGAAEVHVVAVKNEVKELLVLLEDGRDSLDPEIRCVNLGSGEAEFVFRRSEEGNSPSEGLTRGGSPSGGKRWNNSLEPSLREPPRPTKVGGTVPKNNSSAIAQPAAVEGLETPQNHSTARGAVEGLLVEPNAAILKAGAFKVFGERYGLRRLGPNTQLYEAETWNGAVPGRVFRVHQASKEELKGLRQANVICRNYPLSAEGLKKQLKVKDGGETYVIGTRIGTKPVIFLGVRQ